MFETYIKYATSEIRVPLDIRKDKEVAIKYLSYLNDLNIEVKNKDIFVLASWCGFSIGIFSPNKIHAEVKSKTNCSEELVGDFTVPDGNSYSANGIVVHNCNLPSTATEELVSNVYMRAWESGCKGFTIYRDGSRTGVLVSEDSAKASKDKDGRPTNIQNIMAPKRKEKLDCEIKKAKVMGEAWTIFVGLLNGKPYEIFGGLSKFVDIPNKYKNGTIEKINKGNISQYNLIVGEGDDQMIVNDISSIFENKSNEAFTRLISLSLRHGVPVQYLVEQLTKDKYAEMASFSKVISRVLKNYIADGLKVTSEKKCPECNMSNTLIYQEGCMTCKNCKYSKCN